MDGAPGALVSGAWLADRLGEPGLRVLQVDDDELLYGLGHLPGALPLRWDDDLQAQDSRDLVGPAGFASLMARLGIAPETTVVVYGDQGNLWAAYAWWVLRIWGHTRVHMLDGGQAGWSAGDRPLESGPAQFPAPVAHAYPVPACPRPGARAARPDVEAAVASGAASVVDARTPPGFQGQVPAGLGPPLSGAHRGGHIPGALSVPWTDLWEPVSGLIRPEAELRRIFADAGVDLRSPVIVYCVVGAASAFECLVLSELLGCPSVANYDGSWLEWGSTIGLPVAR